MITLLDRPVQVLLVAFAMRGFNQGWNVELERREAPPGRRPVRSAVAASRPERHRGGPERMLASAAERAAVAER